MSQNKKTGGEVLRPDEKRPFACRVCGRLVPPPTSGTRHRNHCPACLHSVHLDNMPGDRSADCGGVMEPAGIWVRKDGEWAIIHRCRRCGALHANRVAADDDPVGLISLAVRPLAQPPFPLHCLARMVEESVDARQPSAGRRHTSS